MTRPTRVEKDCATGVETIIELTDEEIAVMEEAWAVRQAEKDAEEAAALAAAEAKASAEAKLAALGLTSDEVAAIIGR